MKLIAHLIVTTIRAVSPGGARAVIAESLLLKHQLLILNRSRKKAPRLRAVDRVLLGFGGANHLEGQPSTDISKHGHDPEDGHQARSLLQPCSERASRCISEECPAAVQE
jgi:hypothetical protein